MNAILRAQAPVEETRATADAFHDQVFAKPLCLNQRPAASSELELDMPEPEPAPTTDDEAQAAAKVQAMWRGKAGLKKAGEQKKNTLAGSQRILAAKRTIRHSQVAVTVLVMLTTATTTLLPNYLLGAAYGAVANGEGMERVLPMHIGLVCGIYLASVNFLSMEVFAYAMRDTPFLPGTAERICRPLLAGVTQFWFNSNFWMFLDLQNPDSDIALIKGFPGAVIYLVAIVPWLDTWVQPVEYWRLHRSRNHKLPPTLTRTWWNLTAIAGRGTLATAMLLCLFSLVGMHVYLVQYLGVLSFFDKAGTLAEHMGTGTVFEMWPIKYYYVAGLPIMLLAVVWVKPWPQGTRDPVSALLLCNIQQAAIWFGAFAAFNLYIVLGGPDGSVLACQLLIEVLTLLLYLYARVLARRAFGAAPTYEARALFMYILLSDGARRISKMLQLPYTALRHLVRAGC